MKRILAITVAFAILVGSLGNSFIFFRYLLQKNYFATVLCENKANPKLGCAGKCHMKKMLKEQEKRDASPASQENNKKETVTFFELKETEFSFEMEESAPICTIYTMKDSQFEGFAVFHPPLV